MMMGWLGFRDVGNGDWGNGMGGEARWEYRKRHGNILTHGKASIPMIIAEYTYTLIRRLRDGLELNTGGKRTFL